MRRILNNSISLLVVIIVLFLVVPLPKQALDILIVLNIAISIMILMITMSISEALEFSIFPSLLLITTLFRLGLNVSSTRLILSEGGDAGMVILRYADYPGEYCHRNFDFLNHCTGAIYCDHQRSGARLRGGRPLHAGRHARKADGHRRGFELRPY